MRTLGAWISACIMVGCGGGGTGGDGGADAAACDVDLDGWTATVCEGDDCDDDDPNVHPGADDTVGDRVDQNCDDTDGVDADGDGEASVASGGDDCDDADAHIHPGAEDDVGDGVDQSCDGMDGTDVDRDGHASEASGGDDCLDTDDDIHPGALELTTWEIADVAEAADPRFSSVAVDESGAAHVAFRYGDVDAGRLGYATNASGQWVDLEVDPGADVAYGTSIALGEDGVVHIAHFDRGGRALRYVTNDGGEWSAEEVDSDESALCGPFPSIAVTSDGEVTIAYSGGGLRLATGVTGNWTIDPVDPRATVADSLAVAGVSLALEADGTPRVSYATADGILLGIMGASEWRTGAVAGCRFPDCVNTALAVDTEGGAHVVYDESLEGSSSQVTYRADYDDDGLFNTELTASGYAPSIATWYGGQVHIATLDAGRIVYTANAGGGLATEEIEDAPPAGNTAVALGAGLVYVTFPGTEMVRVARRSIEDRVDDDCDGIAF
ncbi:MAG: hypothetical protein HY996_11480 [Micrococcales bacterium]|nr:hypothetical protein [Micrococcales bacterium]